MPNATAGAGGRVAGRYDQKKRPGDKRIPGSESGQEQEDAQQEVEKQQEPEKARLQAQMGNQAILSMLSSGMEGVGGGGVEVEPAHRKKEPEKETPQHGGDDDADPGPLTVQDLTQSWNPGTKRSEDRPAFLEPMPDDELPPEDPEYLEQVRSCARPHPMPPLTSHSLDALLQPSPEVVRIAITDWSRCAGQWIPPTLLARLVHRLVAPPAPVLQDPHGRVLPSRSRAAAITSCLLMESPALLAAPNAITCAALDFTLELAARRHRVRAVQIIARELEGKELPVARKILEQHLEDYPRGEVLPRRPTESAEVVLDEILVSLADWEDPFTLVPDLQPPSTAPDPDDPLGLDEILEAMTGGPADPAGSVYDAAIQSAERLAAASARSRVMYAGTGVAVAEVAQLWSSGSPTRNLATAMSSFDRDIAGCLQLLVEIARAAQRRSVPPEGLRAGLRRAARSLKKIRTRGNRQLVEVVWGILPGEPDLSTTVHDLPEEVQYALAAGQPADALEWIQAQPASLERDTAVVLVRAVAGALPADLHRPLRDLVRRWREESDDVLSRTCLEIALGSAALFSGALDEATEIGDLLLERGRLRRNGLLVAEGALLGMEAHLAAGDEAALQERRIRAGNLLWRMGARGALSLLARWQPPEVDEDGDWV